MAEIDTLSNEIPSANAARLPALGAPELSVDYLAKMKEIIEVLMGRRGSTWDRAVTFRDMQGGGLAGLLPGAAFGAATFNPATGQVLTNGGAAFDIDAALRGSAAYKDLLLRIGSIEELETLPDQISAQLQDVLTDLARQRGADIRTTEAKLQNTSESIAWRLDEITASLNGAAAGAREYSATYADSLRAVAIRVEQVSADLEAAGGAVNVQEQITAIADAVDGLKGQYSLKIQTNPTSGQPPVIAGISLAVEDPLAGPGTSSLIFLSEKVGFYTENGTLNPFSISGNQVMMTDVIAKRLRVIMDDGTVVLDAGKRLSEQTQINPNLLPNLSDWTSEGTPAWLHNDSATGYAKDGWHNVFPKNTGGLVMRRLSRPIRLEANTTYTLSFFAVSDAPNTPLIADLVPDTLPQSGFVVGTTKQRFVFKWTTPNTGDANSCTFRMFGSNLPGQVLAWDIKLERGPVDTAWCDSVVTATNAAAMVNITSLAALSAFFGSVQLGLGGALWAGQTDYDTGTGLRLGTDGEGNPYLSMRSTNGKYLRIRPSTETFEWNGAKISGADMTESVPLVDVGANVFLTRGGTSATGTRTAEISGGRLPYQSIEWTAYQGIGTIKITGGQKTASVSWLASGTTGEGASGGLSCTVVDANGMVGTSSFSIDVSFT